MALDAAGNVYITDGNNNALKELVKAWVPGGAVSESGAAGSDQLQPVLPTNEMLTGFFTPTSDQSWLTIGSIANGVISFSFTQNTGAARAAHITVLGQQITVTQAAGTEPYFLSGNSTRFIAGQNNTFTVNAGGNPVSALTETGPLPPGVSYPGVFARGESTTDNYHRQ